MLNPCSRSVGEVPERSNGAVSKTVVLLAGDRGFESLPLRQIIDLPIRFLFHTRSMRSTGEPSDSVLPPNYHRQGAERDPVDPHHARFGEAPIFSSSGTARKPN